ncbi:MAG: sugar phosphate isomerase/epimerase family protein [Isosphaeraceae bacterium]
MPANSLFTRRGFVGLTASAAALAPLAAGARANALASLAREPQAADGPAADPWLGLKIGIASYTFSRIPLDATIEGIRRVGVHYVSIKESHLPLKSTAEERKAVVAKFRKAGITPLSCGVISLKGSPSDLRRAFEYARNAGIPTIVGAPSREALPTLEPLVKEFDIRLAIHNHGPEDKVWPSPLDVWEAVQKLDERIGLCIDVGHTARCGVDPAKAIHTCAERLYDVHLKDLSHRQNQWQTVEVGRGDLDIRGILQALRDVHFRGDAGLEYEKDMHDPLPGVAESIGYIRGTLASMKDR